MYICTDFCALLVGLLAPQHDPDFNIERMRQGRLGWEPRIEPQEGYRIGDL